MTEETLFEQAVQLPNAERMAFLNRECPDPVLRARVEALLAADAASRSPLDGPIESTRMFSEPAVTGSYRPAPTAEEAEGVVIAGRYKLRQQIGEGGMGTVWMADQTEPVKRKVAVKLIRVDRGQSRTILARFEAERQAIALMDHPHIAKLLDAGTTETGSPYFIMELVKGIPLNEFCDQQRLTITERLNLFTQICSAVQHAHQKGIIHRDLKPGNILVENHDGKPVPKVIDFGLAKATTGLQLTEQSMFTGFGAVMGTPLYMAPEQAGFNAIDVDTRADVYALGVILYELLTGTTPLTMETIKKAALDEMLKLIREQEAPTPSSRLSSVESTPSVAANRQIEPAKLGRFVKGELDWIVLKALSKDRDRRYETANGFAKDIERFLNHEPVQAGPPSASYRLRKFVQRNRGQVLAASLVLLVLLAGLGATSYGFYQARRERHRAEWAEELAIRSAQEANQAAAAERRAKENEAEQRRLVEYRAAVVSVDAALEFAKPSNPEGLVRLAGTLKVLPPEATALRQGVVTNLLVWGQEIAPAYTRPGGHIHAVSPDGRVGLISSFGETHTWEARDLVTGQRLALLGDEGTANTEPYYEDRGACAVFSGNGKLAATLHEPKVGGAPTVRVWDTATWRERFNLRPVGRTYEVRLNDDGTRLGTRSAMPNPKPADESDDRRFYAHLWNARTGDLMATLDHGGKRVDHVHFSPDGRVLVSASESVVRLWSATDGRRLHTLGPHADAVILTALSPSGKTVAVLAGPRVYWWSTADGSPAGPSQELGFSLHPGDLDEFHRFKFETEDVLIVRAWNMHGVSFSRAVGGAVCIRGEAKAHTLDAVCSDGRYAMTDDRHVYSLSPFRRLETPPGRKFPPEVRASANGRRYVQVGPDLIDLVAEVPIGPRLPKADAGIYPVRAAGFGFVSKEMGQYYWNSRQMLIPDPAVLPPDEVMELWAKVLARGHIDQDSGLFKRDDETTWEKNRRELNRRAEPASVFPFPGVAASDPTYWLRQEYQEAKEATERLSLAERLVAAKPSWQNHLRRANSYARIGRHVEAIHEDLRVRELAKDEYRQNPDEQGSGAWQAVHAILSEPDRPKEEYELVLRWLRESTDETMSVALTLYRLSRPEEAIRVLSALDLPRPANLVAGLASPWAAAVVVYVNTRSLGNHWTSESTLPFVIEALCHHKLGNMAARDRCLTTARILIRSRDEMEDPLNPRGNNWYGPLVDEALRAVRPK